MSNLLVVREKKRVKVLSRLRYMKDSCRAERCDQGKSVFEAVGLAAKLENDAVEASSTGVASIVNPCTDKLTVQCLSNRAEVVLLTAKLSYL